MNSQILRQPHFVDQTNILSLGPHYTGDHSLNKRKQQALEFIGHKTEYRDDSLLSESIQAIISDAWSSYGFDTYEGFVPPLQFALMMEKDGCFFTLAVLKLLGHQGIGSNGYGFDFEPFVEDRKDDVIIPSMLLVGNQIPYQVLKVIMTNKFIRGLVESLLVKDSCTLLEKAFYSLLNLGGLNLSRHHHSLLDVVGLKLGRHHPDLTEPSSNLLESLHQIALGIRPKEMPRTIPGEMAWYHPDDIHNTLKTAMNLWLKERIEIWPLEKSQGIRQMKLTRFNIRCFKSVLYLPVLVIDENLETVFSSLIAYEMRAGRKEVMSYIKILSELIGNSRDCKLLHDNGIVVGDVFQRAKLPNLLRKVASKSLPCSTDAELQKIRLQLDEYYTPRWARYIKFIPSLSQVISAISLVFGIITFYRHH